MHLLTADDLDRIQAWVSKGAKLYVGSDHAGRRKVKVVRGPFGLFTERFQCTDADVERLRKMLVTGAESHAA